MTADPVLSALLALGTAVIGWLAREWVKANTARDADKKLIGELTDELAEQRASVSGFTRQLADRDAALATVGEELRESRSEIRELRDRDRQTLIDNLAALDAIRQQNTALQIKVAVGEATASMGKGTT